MIEVNEKQFIRTFILKLILVQKDSVFDLWDNEKIDLPNNYLEILDEIIKDNDKKGKYCKILPTKDKDIWRENVKIELNNFLNSEGVSYKENASHIVIDLNRIAILEILSDKSITLEQKVKISNLAEDFLILKTKTKPKVKTLV